jgi:DNA repair exonuclease SbcCD nuclease subunit
MLNIAFFADTHLGYRAKTKSNEKGINIRVQDGYNAFKEIVTQIIHSEVKIDAVIIAGDLFHSSHPSIRDIAFAQWYLRLLAKHGIPVYSLAGNHDANDIRAEMAAVAAVDDPDRKIFALHKPYARYELADGILLHSVSHHGLHGDEAPEITPELGSVNLFTTHGAALDPKNQALMRCADSPREQFIPIEMIVDETFTAKLLGHYHSRYAVGGEGFNAWYSGSTIRRGFSDAPGERGWILVQVDGNGKTTWTPKNIHQRPQYDLDPIDADGLTSSEVMDLLEMNIKRTMDTDEAPIVRQRLLNVTRGTLKGLDAERIDDLTKHMLIWQLDKRRPEDSAVEQLDKTHKVSLDKKQAINIVESFNGWAKEQGKHVPEEFQDLVIKDAEHYLKTARMANLGE